jgi:glycyl-tRNA synthetase
MMFKTFQGVTEDGANEIYLRPETAQGIFVNFKNVLRSTRRKLPMGVCQIGKVFRNEITPGNFIFRTREFEQMELEFFCEPGKDLEWFEYWRGYARDFLLSLGMKEENLRLRDHDAEELSHYSKATTDFDLNAHQTASGESMEYLDPITNERFVPYCVEPSLGVDRASLAFLCDADEEQPLGEGDSRVVLHLHPALAPFKACVLPLQKNKLGGLANEIYKRLAPHFMVDYDETGSIGKRYRRQDEIGTPYCVTVDFQTQEDQTVTLRDRDSMEQTRLPIDKLVETILAKLEF